MEDRRDRVGGSEGRQEREQGMNRIDELLALHLAAERLAAAGILFHVPGLQHNGVERGFFDISADRIVAYHADPVSWYTEVYGASREQVEAFQAFVTSGYRCNKVTRSGVRCSRRIEEFWHLGVRDYKPALDGFCWQHGPSPKAR